MIKALSIKLIVLIICVRFCNGFIIISFVIWLRICASKTVITCFVKSSCLYFWRVSNNYTYNLQCGFLLVKIKANVTSLSKHVLMCVERCSTVTHNYYQTSDKIRS
jgi:hypothetical protein